MRFYLACYDAGADAVAGSFWTWHHPDIQTDALDRLYYDFASKHLPLPSSGLARFLTLPNGLCGGCAGVSPRWSCWYRFVDGGTDIRGRPGRIVLLAAFFNPSETRGENTADVLRHQVLQDCARQAKSSCPILPPRSLELLISGVPAGLDPVQWEKLNRELSMDLNCKNAIFAGGNLIANIPPQMSFDCTVQSGPDGESMRVQLLPSRQSIAEESGMSWGERDATSLEQEPADFHGSHTPAMQPSHCEAMPPPIRAKKRPGILPAMHGSTKSVYISIFLVGFIIGLLTGWACWKRAHTTIPKLRTQLNQQIPTQKLHTLPLSKQVARLSSNSSKPPASGVAKPPVFSTGKKMVNLRAEGRTPTKKPIPAKVK
ncbi:MAG: hypothetical protein ACP5I8_00985 [Phycisphaerae bacterium]